MSTKKQVFVIKQVPDKVLRDYAGMNYYAAKALGFKPSPKKNEIFIDKHYTGAKKTQLIKHEEEEAHLMANGYSYFTAHKLALNAEHKRKPRWMQAILNK